jgi:Fe-S-cluster-containing hydrogenase component 2
VGISDERCIKCRSCMSVCPFGAVGFDPIGKRMFKCDQCDGDPTCVKYCEPQAIQYVDVTNMRAKRGWDRARTLSDVVRKFDTELARAEQ